MPSKRTKKSRKIRAGGGRVDVRSREEKRLVPKNKEIQDYVNWLQDEQDSGANDKTASEDDVFSSQAPSQQFMPVVQAEEFSAEYARQEVALAMIKRSQLLQATASELGCSIEQLRHIKSAMERNQQLKNKLETMRIELKFFRQVIEGVKIDSKGQQKRVRPSLKVVKSSQTIQAAAHELDCSEEVLLNFRSIIDSNQRLEIKLKVLKRLKKLFIYAENISRKELRGEKAKQHFKNVAKSLETSTVIPPTILRPPLGIIGLFASSQQRSLPVPTLQPITGVLKIK